MINFLNIKKGFSIYHEDKSHWAYCYCYIIKDKPEVYKYITDPWDAYKYCRYIKDLPVIRKYITDSLDAYCYCRYVKDRPEVRKLITEDEHLQWYKEWKKKQ